MQLAVGGAEFSSAAEGIDNDKTSCILLLVVYGIVYPMIRRSVFIASVIMAVTALQARAGSDSVVPNALTSVAVNNAWDLPPLLLDDLQGRQRKLYDWHGKVIILNFWASWCGPCLTEIPLIVRYQREYAEAGLQVIGVALDEARKVRNVVRSLHINYPVLVSDPEDKQGLLQNWGDPQQVLPYSVVIDHDGRIRFTQVGIMDEETFTDYVLPLLDAASDGAI
jgi:thiol-disulfide isomerase/thioredoxin